MKRTIALTFIFLLAMIWAACSIPIEGPEELKTIHVICAASGDTVTVQVTDDHGSFYVAGCGQFPDSVVVITP